jgi:TonB family protein
MALKREFSESRERMGTQNPGKPANKRAENVDNLVSSFLAELSNLSSEVNGPADQDAVTETPAETNDSRMPPHFRLQDDSRSRAVLDLERVDTEIEESLAELEQLKSSKAGANRKPIPEAQPELKPAVSVPKVEEPPKKSTPSPPPIEPGADLRAPLVSRDSTNDEAWKRPDLFRNAISMPARTERRPVLAWVLAGLILVAILAIAAIYLFKSDTHQPAAKEKTGMLEEYKSDAATQSAYDRNEKQELLPAAADLKKSQPPSEHVIQPERRKESSPSSGPEVGSRSSMGGAKAGSSSSISGSGRPVEDRQNGPPPKIRTAQEPSPQAAPQNAPVSASPDTPSPIATSTESAVQPKQEPAPPAAQSNAPSVPEAEVHADAPPALPIETPKPVTPVESEQTSVVPVSPRKVQAAEIIKRVQPEYPVLARRQKIGGTVEVEVDVNEKGEVVLARAVSGSSLLRPAAEAAIMKWRFKPASVGGVNISSKAKVSVNFSLH